MLQSTIHQDDPTKSFKHLVKNTIDQTKQMSNLLLTQAINFCKCIFFEGVTTSGKFAISYTVEKMIPLQLVIYHLTFTPKCLDRKFRNRAACQRNHSNERHIIYHLAKML